VHRLIGEADVDKPVGLRNGEHEAVALAGHRHDQRGDRVPEGVRTQDHVGAPGRLEPHGGVELIRPHAGRVDHGPGPDLVLLAGDGVAHCRAAGIQPLDPAAGQYPGAVPGRGSGERDHEACVVDELAVPLHEPAAQAGPTHPRYQSQHLGGADPAGSGQRGRRRSGRRAQGVGGGEPRTGEHGTGGRHRRGQRKHEGQRGDEVRCRTPEQDVALGGTLVRQPQVSGAEVTQPAVDELRTPPGCAEGKVVRVDGGDGQAAAGGVESHAGPGDSEADDEQVHDAAAGGLGQFAGAAGRRQRGGARHGRTSAPVP
jgi:hypothetical protein